MESLAIVGQDESKEYVENYRLNWRSTLRYEVTQTSKIALLSELHGIRHLSNWQSQALKGRISV